jgi:diaminopimelate epimerase
VPFRLTREAVQLICDRHLGIGSDGILEVIESGGADFGVRIFNPDGSDAEKSGNGIRIFAKYLREHGYTTKDRFTVDTASRVRRNGTLAGSITM